MNVSNGELHGIDSKISDAKTSLKSLERERLLILAKIILEFQAEYAKFQALKVLETPVLILEKPTVHAGSNRHLHIHFEHVRMPGCLQLVNGELTTEHAKWLNLQAAAFKIHLERCKCTFSIVMFTIPEFYWSKEIIAQMNELC